MKKGIDTSNMDKKYKVYIQAKRTKDKELVAVFNSKDHAEMFIENEGWSDWIADHQVWFKRDWTMKIV